MKYKLLRLFGVDVYFHWTFFLLPVYLVIDAFLSGKGAVEALWYLALLIMIFTSVVMHEFGHILMARKFKVETRDVVLYPIGGAARMEKMPEKPWQEILVAIAGPFVNVVIFVLGYLYYAPNTIYDIAGFFNPESGEIIEYSGASLMAYFILVNGALVLFNLIPAFPMDGGRILRAATQLFTNRKKATKIAMYVAHVLAIGFIYFGITNGLFMIILIGVFVIVTSRMEYKMEESSALLSNKKLHDIMATQFETIEKDWLIINALEFVRYCSSDYVIVVDETQKPIGLTNLELLRSAIDNERHYDTVDSCMETDFESISSDEPIAEVFRMMISQNIAYLPVRDATNKVIGVIERNKFLEALTKTQVEK